MAKNKTEEEGRDAASVADIAATLLKPQDVAETTETNDEEVPSGGDNDDDAEAVITENDNDETVDVDETEGDEQEDEQSDDEDEDDDESDYLDIRDDDLITVMVDGEEQELTIGDLKKAHSLGGATEKRLQEATEERKAAHAERTQMLEKLAEQERAVSDALSNLDDSVFTPVIPEPNEQLRRSNPEQYLVHKEAYEEDQRRIANAKQAVQTQLKEIQEKRQERLKEYSEQAGKIILQEIPELAKRETAQPMLQKLAATAKAYGYTDQEISSALDPRMFMLVRDAMKYREMTDKSRERTDPTNLEGQKQKKVRRLRSGSTSSKNRVRQADKQRKAAVDRARKTGKPQDVAATLLVPKG